MTKEEVLILPMRNGNMKNYNLDIGTQTFLSYL